MAAWEAIVPLEERLIVKRVLDSAFRLHRGVGPGFLESVYQRLFAEVLRQDGLSVESQVWLPVRFAGITIERAQKVDLRVNGKVLVEIKAASQLRAEDRAQLISYLKASGHVAGVLINFNGALLSQSHDKLVHPDLLRGERGVRGAQPPDVADVADPRIRGVLLPDR